MEKPDVEKYGLHVAADYRAVNFLPGSATWIDDTTLELTGMIDVDCAKSGRLSIRTKGSTFAMLTIAAKGDLVIEHIGRVDDVVRLHRTVVLNEGASLTDMTAVEVRGVFDLFTKVEHRGASSSRLLAKAAVAGKGKFIGRGAIVMTSSANGSDGFERIDALLLDPEARADVLPTIDVATDDVRCKHGAAIGSMDEEQLFYLASRGLSEQEAKAVCAEGFLNEICVYGRT